VCKNNKYTPFLLVVKMQQPIDEDQLHAALARDEDDIEWMAAMAAFTALQGMQPDAELLKYILAKRAVKDLPANSANASFSQYANDACPELRAGRDSEPYKNLKRVIVDKIPMVMPGCRSPSPPALASQTIPFLTPCPQP
jgi:hypothetical protein